MRVPRDVRKGAAVVLGILALIALLWLWWTDTGHGRRAGGARDTGGGAVAAPPPDRSPPVPPADEPAAPDEPPARPPAEARPPSPAPAEPEREIGRVELRGREYVFRYLHFELKPDRGAPEGAPVLDDGWVIVDTRSRIANLWFPGRQFDPATATVVSTLRQWVGPGAERPAETARGLETGLNVVRQMAQAAGRWKHLESPLFGPAGAGWNREAAATLRFRVGGVRYTLHAAVRYPAEGRPVLIVRDGG